MPKSSKPFAAKLTFAQTGLHNADICEGDPRCLRQGNISILNMKTMTSDGKQWSRGISEALMCRASGSIEIKESVRIKVRYRKNKKLTYCNKIFLAASHFCFPAWAAECFECRTKDDRQWRREVVVNCTWPHLLRAGLVGLREFFISRVSVIMGGDPDIAGFQL